MGSSFSGDSFGIPKPLEEMARIGVEGGLDFRIYSEPLGNPSFHIVSPDFEIVVTISDLKILEVKRINKSKYKFEKGADLSGEVLKATQSLMARTVPRTNITRKQYLLTLWNDNNPDYEIEDDFIKW